MIIKSRGGLFDIRQAIPGYGWKIMVFVVEAHIERNMVEYSIVTIGLLFTLCEIMFLYPPGT
jgi:hypothetical protein